MEEKHKVLLGKYRHFKGTVVEVIDVAYDSETLEEIVVYKHPDPVKGLGPNTLWVRPLTMFFEEVEREGRKMKRFEKIED